jgi:hypothetical protein
MGIDEVVWDVNGIKHEYTGKQGVHKAGFSIRKIEKNSEMGKAENVEHGLFHPEISICPIEILNSTFDPKWL